MAEEADDRKRRTNRLRLRLLAVCLFFPFCGCPCVFSVVPVEGPARLEPLRADLEKRLPDGSSWAEAEAWFASHGLKPHDILKGRKPTDIDPDGTIRRVGLGVTIPNSTLLEHAEIRIEVYFDNGGKLEKRIIYRFVYSL